MNERVKKALQIMSEDFDTICIIATKHSFEKQETERYVYNYGNRYAIECSVQEVADGMGSMFVFGVGEGDRDDG